MGDMLCLITVVAVAVLVCPLFLRRAPAFVAFAKAAGGASWPKTLGTVKCIVCSTSFRTHNQGGRVQLWCDPAGYLERHWGQGRAGRQPDLGQARPRSRGVRTDISNGPYMVTLLVNPPHWLPMPLRQTMASVVDELRGQGKEIDRPWKVEILGQVLQVASMLQVARYLWYFSTKAAASRLMFELFSRSDLILTSQAGA
ncbi:hypothetical protein SELMODRAFT_429617 [Selaginella moellendorffii]|uniref:Uncharacterized protein n=1 Tax=Selaginella moellendorffii TaxID=88036 RepID=D8T6R7_SELML|nr:hypothetical protein SELMODRAFT_429617 [Selaginella moellendorffii]